MILKAALGFAGVLLAPLPLPAQAGDSAERAVETITAADVIRHIGVIADDSMLGRATPSHGLELTARYVAEQFKRFGLKPGGDAGTWFQHYPIPERGLDFARSQVVFTAAGKNAAAGFASTAYLAMRRLPERFPDAPTVLVAGPHTGQSLQQVDVRGKVVLYVPPADTDSAMHRQIMQTLSDASNGLIILTDQDSASFAKRLELAQREPTASITSNWAVYVWPAAVQAVLKAGGLDLTRVRATSTPIVRELPALTVRLEIKSVAATAPNTIGILEGSDPRLRNEYLVFSAHMDHIGGSPLGPGDRIYNGADDDASGTAGVLELAEAFTRPGARPRRSLIFLAVSGEERGKLGSKYFVEHPPVPLGQVVADLHMDMIGRLQAQNMILLKGTQYSDLATTVGRVVPAHPELRLSVALRTDMTQGSDHAQFAEKKIPILFFYDGGAGELPHPDYHEVTDAPDKITADAEANVLRLIFYVGREVANADQRPQWNEQNWQNRRQNPDGNGEP